MTDTDSQASGGGADRSALVRLLIASLVVVWLALVVALLLIVDRPRGGPSDVVAHGVLFAGLTVTAFAASAIFRASPPWLPFALLVGAAVVTEVLQEVVVDGRSGSFRDLAMNLFGVVTGAILFNLLRRVAPTRWPPVVVAASVVMSLGISAFVVIDAVERSVWWRCRGHPTISQGSGNAELGPLVMFDGSQDGWIPPVDSTRLVPARGFRPSPAVWCSAMRSGEFTLVVRVDGAERSARRFQPLVGGATSPANRFSNLDLVVHEDKLLILMRSLDGPRSVVMEVSGVFLVAVPQEIVVRYFDGELVVDWGGRTRQAVVEMDLRGWEPVTPFFVLGGEPVGESVVSVAMAFYDRALTDEETTGAGDSAGLLWP